MSEAAELNITKLGLFKRKSPTVEALRRFSRHRSARVGLILLALFIILAVFAPWIAPYDPIKPIMTEKRRSGPCIHLLGCPADKNEHLMGMDGNNRDMFSRIVYGSQLSLQIGFATVTFAILVGGILGAIMTGVLADPSLGGTGVYDYVADKVADFDMTAQVIAQLWGVGTTIVWSAVVSLVAYKLVDLTIGLRVSEDTEREGLDTTSHGERAYD